MRLVVVRDLANAQLPQDKSLILVRIAHFTVSGGKWILLSAPIATHINHRRQLVYTFEVAEEHTAHTKLSMSEIEDYQGRSGYFGDGTSYEYTSERKATLHERVKTLAEQSEVE